MIKFLICFILVFNSFILAKYEDKNPSYTSPDDIKLLRHFENKLYKNTTVKEFKCEQLKLVTFINKNKIEKFDYNKLLVKVNAQVNNSEYYSDTDGSYKDRDRASVQLNASYNIFDKKTDLQIKKKQLEFRENIINDISKYCEYKNDLLIIENNIDLLNLKQIRSKAREDSGQIYLDERITLIEKIIDKKNEFNTISIKLDSIKLMLLNKVKTSAKKKLKGLL